METLLDLSIHVSQGGAAEMNLPFSLIEDWFDGSTINDCETVFMFVESRAATLTHPDFLKKGKLTMLRACNEVLRRLSKAKNTVFCGKILMFLAAAFPLSERSGVNAKSAFNTANVTSIEDDGDEEMSEASKMELDAKPTGGELNSSEFEWWCSDLRLA